MDNKLTPSCKVSSLGSSGSSLRDSDAPERVLRPKRVQDASLSSELELVKEELATLRLSSEADSKLLLELRESLESMNQDLEESRIELEKSKREANNLRRTLEY